MADDRPPPPITVRVPGGAVFDSAPRAPRPKNRRTDRLLLGSVLAVVALLVAGGQVRAAQRRASEAEARALRVDVLHAEHAPQRLAPTGPVVQATVSLLLRSSRPVTVLTAALDGDEPSSAGRVRLAPDGTLTVHWRVRCAEVGNVRGPSALDLRVRGRHGDHLLQVPLLEQAAVFHLSAVDTCSP